MYKIVLFDLDGTLVDTERGLVNSVVYALSKMGITETDINKIKAFIGPSIRTVFRDIYDMNNEDVEAAATYFRKYYMDKGIYQCSLYQGVKKTLIELKKNNKYLAIATSKPIENAIEVLRFLKILQYFDHCEGGNMDGTHTCKTEIINDIISRYKHIDKSEMIMIGDRKFDIEGAKNNGIDTIGVLYGYGSIEEINASKPDFLISEFDWLVRYIF